MRQCSILAMYGQKPADLTNLIERCQHSLSRMLDIHFRPYALDSIHATIVGLERSDPGRLFNDNFQNIRNEKREMDILGYSKWLSESAEFPINIRIGGFKPIQIPFLDRNKPPYERSFGIYTGKAVMVGWPVDGDEGTESAPRLVQSLDRLRRMGAEFNILHAYHLHNQSIDNAFYFRIGMVFEYREARVHEIEEALRQVISQYDPVCISIDYEKLTLVSYLDQTLPAESTMACLLKDVDADTITRYYQNAEDAQ